jgi:hypothetical protein
MTEAYNAPFMTMQQRLEAIRGTYKCLQTNYLNMYTKGKRSEDLTARLDTLKVVIESLDTTLAALDKHPIS